MSMNDPSLEMTHETTNLLPTVEAHANTQACTPVHADTPHPKESLHGGFSFKKKHAGVM